MHFMLNVKHEKYNNNATLNLHKNWSHR